MGFARAERPDIEAPRPERGDQGGIVDLRVVGQGRHGAVAVEGRDRARRRRRPAIRATRSMPGKRSGVAKAVRGSMTVTERSRARAIGHRAWLIWTAPITTRRTGGACTVRKTERPSASTRPLLPEARCRARRSARGSAGDLGLAHHALGAAVEVGHQDGGAARGALGIEDREGLELHGRRLRSRARRRRGCARRRTGRPARRSRRRPRTRSPARCPSAIASRPSVITAPSTQPPETEPRKLPSPSTTRWLPTGRGAEPQVSMTVASATAAPLAPPGFGRAEDVVVGGEHGPDELRRGLRPAA